MATSAPRGAVSAAYRPRLAWLKDRDHVQWFDRASGCKINEQNARGAGDSFRELSAVGLTACRTVLRHSQHAAL